MQTRPVLLHSFAPPRFDAAVNTELSLGIAASNVRIAALAPSVGIADGVAEGDGSRALLFDRAQGKLFVAQTTQQRMVMVDLPPEYKTVASYTNRCPCEHLRGGVRTLSSKEGGWRDGERAGGIGQCGV
jgi:hypothetical protein